MIDWKNIARAALKERREFENYCDEQHHQFAVIADEVAKAAGTPRFSETQTSVYDAIGLGLQRIGATVPKFIPAPRDTVLDTRLRQIAYEMSIGTGTDRIKGGRIGRALLRWLIRKWPP